MEVVRAVFSAVRKFDRFQPLLLNFASQGHGNKNEETQKDDNLSAEGINI